MEDTDATDAADDETDDETDDDDEGVGEGGNNPISDKIDFAISSFACTLVPPIL